MRKTKLVITMGPAIEEDKKLVEVLKIADVIRINASHSTCEERTPVVTRIREILSELGRTVPIFLDLQGPKWRLGLLEAPVDAPDGSIGHFYSAEREAPTGAEWAVPVPHPELFQGAEIDQTWLVDDGALEFKVTETHGDYVSVKTLAGGAIKQRKGLMPIGMDVQIDPLTKKDFEDIEWGIKQNVDLFAQSFIRRASDLATLEEAIKSMGGNQPIIAKIEHPKAIENLEPIVAAAWGIMVARGDLGVELGVDKVPALQKRIIHTASQYMKPVITATQMLESMIEHPMPTRAESSDIANAIWDGTDAVMLSAESAVGKHPLESIHWLAKIAEDADRHDSILFKTAQSNLAPTLTNNIDVNIAFAACCLAKEIGAAYILAFSEVGNIVRMLAHTASGTPIIGATTSPVVARRLGIMRNVQSILTPRAEHLSELLKLVMPVLRETFNISPGDKVVMVAGHPLWVAGQTNMVRVIVF